MAILCDDCKRRRTANVLRVLDCKRESCRSVVEEAPAVTGSLCGDCLNDYSDLKSILNDRDIGFTEKKDLVRGLDYYTGTVFEVIHSSLGAQDAIAAGGRYDELTKVMGGPDVGATGYAVGIERLLMAIDKKKIELHKPGIFIIPMKANYRQDVFRILDYLRKNGIPCEMELTERSFKGQMRRADKEKRKYVIIVGEDEVKKRKLLVKNMENGEQDLLSVGEAVKRFKKEFRD